MRRYNLQINEWTTWTNDCSFDSAIVAKNYARENYPQNEWRVYDNARRQIVHENDVSETLRQVAGADLARFERVSEWTANQRIRQAQQSRMRRITESRRVLLANRRFTYHDSFCCTGDDDKVNWLKEGF